MSDIASQVSLREITAETVRTITDLAVHPAQRRFVATNAESLAEALFAPEAWYRAIQFGDVPVGFVMLFDASLRQPPPPAPEVWVWRFMVDARYQRQGIGRAALHLVIAHVRAKGLFSRLLLSCVPGDGSPERLYRSLGFVPTGEVDAGEVVMARALETPAT